MFSQSSDSTQLILQMNMVHLEWSLDGPSPTYKSPCFVYIPSENLASLPSVIQPLFIQTLKMEIAVIVCLDPYTQPLNDQLVFNMSCYASWHMAVHDGSVWLLLFLA